MKITKFQMDPHRADFSQVSGRKTCDLKACILCDTTVWFEQDRAIDVIPVFA